jgi:type I restriction enzyme M protein
VRDVAALIALGEQRDLLELADDKIRYPDIGREENADPEERVRAAVYVDLVETYQYSPTCIAFEVPVPRRVPNDFADIVVYTDDTRSTNYIVIETKSEGCGKREFKQAIEQGFGNANSLRASFLLVDSGNESCAFDVESFPANERNNNIISDLPINYGRVPEYRFIRGGTDDLAPVSFSDLERIFKKCHDVIWSGGKLDPATAFDEMSKLLFAKIEDERSTANGKHYDFQVGKHENEVIVSQRVRDRYAAACRNEPNVFDEPIRVKDLKIQSVVRHLEGISLSETDLDSKGQAFEQFLGVVFRGGLGQYFTRRQIVQFMVDILDPHESDLVIDPCCGSGGFLLYSMKKVSADIEQDYAGNQNLIHRKQYDFARRNIYGIEINEKIARVAMMDMIVNDDGHTNIENNTGLNSVFRNPSIHLGRFTVVLTNPPFGTNIKKDDRDALGQGQLASFAFGSGRKSQASEILFLERYHQLLVDDATKHPRVGVVLSTGALNNPSNKQLINWIKLNFKILGVVNLPDFAFRKAGSGMKTCLLFLEKRIPPASDLESIGDYDVFFALAEHIGYDSTLRPDATEFPNILKHFREGSEDREAGVYRVPFSDLANRLDPLYYHNRFRIKEEVESLEAAGHLVMPLATLLESLSAGKSPEGGVTRSIGEIPSVVVENITPDGGIDMDATINYVPESFYEGVATKAGLDVDDLLIAKDGATTGKTAVVTSDFPFESAICSEHVFRMRVKSGVNPHYLHAFLNGDLGQLQIQTIASGGAQGGITKDFVREVMVPVVSAKEQKAIARTWTKRMGKAADQAREAQDARRAAREDVDQAIFQAEPVDDSMRDALENSGSLEEDV